MQLGCFISSPESDRLGSQSPLVSCVIVKLFACCNFLLYRQHFFSLVMSLTKKHIYQTNPVYALRGCLPVERLIYHINIYKYVPMSLPALVRERKNHPPFTLAATRPTTTTSHTSSPSLLLLPPLSVWGCCSSHWDLHNIRVSFRSRSLCFQTHRYHNGPHFNQGSVSLWKVAFVNRSTRTSFIYFSASFFFFFF